MNEPLLEKESGCVKIDTSTSQYPDRESIKTHIMVYHIKYKRKVEILL